MTWSNCSILRCWSYCAGRVILFLRLLWNTSHLFLRLLWKTTYPWFHHFFVLFKFVKFKHSFLRSWWKNLYPVHLVFSVYAYPSHKWNKTKNKFIFLIWFLSCVCQCWRFFVYLHSTDSTVSGVCRRRFLRRFRQTNNYFVGHHHHHLLRPSPDPPENKNGF